MKRRRWFIEVIVLLLIGAVINVAVAWIVPNTLGPRSKNTRTWEDGSITTHLLPTEVEHGWPLLALASEVPNGRGSTITTVEIGDKIQLALTPLWPGFAFNTMFYATICWSLLAIPIALRRRRRIKRSQCPACAYPIGANNVCTECGRALEHRRINRI